MKDQIFEPWKSIHCMMIYNDTNNDCSLNVLCLSCQLHQSLMSLPTASMIYSLGGARNKQVISTKIKIIRRNNIYIKNSNKQVIRAPILISSAVVMTGYMQVHFN